LIIYGEGTLKLETMSSLLLTTKNGECTNLQNYVFLGTFQPALVDASIVLACKFQMIPRQQCVKGVYTLFKETLDVINYALDAF
jgi:hypothetical protein